MTTTQPADRGLIRRRMLAGFAESLTAAQRAYPGRGPFIGLSSGLSPAASAMTCSASWAALTSSLRLATPIIDGHTVQEGAQVSFRELPRSSAPGSWSKIHRATLFLAKHTVPDSGRADARERLD